MSHYDAMREMMDHAIDRDICNLYFYHVMMGLINKAESEHKFLYDEFMNAKGERTKAENAKLRELVRDMWHDGMCDCDEFGACAKCEYGYLDRMHELGIEVES